MVMSNMKRVMSSSNLTRGRSRKRTYRGETVRANDKIGMFIIFLIRKSVNFSPSNFKVRLTLL